jgi:hypothetical protein
VTAFSNACFLTQNSPKNRLMVFLGPQLVSFMRYLRFFVIFDVKKAKPGILGTDLTLETVISEHCYVANVLGYELKITRAEGEKEISLGVHFLGQNRPKNAIFELQKFGGPYRGL